MARWREDQHPRDQRGRFTERGGGWAERLSASFAPLGHQAPATTATATGLTPRMREQMTNWRRGTRQPGRRTLPKRTVREVQLAEYQRLRDNRQAQLDKATAAARRRAKRDYPGDSVAQAEAIEYNWDLRQYRHEVEHYDKQMEQLRGSTDPLWDQIHNAGLPPRAEAAQQLDRSNPLAVYGDMLQIGGGAASHNHVSLFEQGFPPEWHALLAQHFAKNRHGGVWLGSQAACWLDDASDLATQHPRGWGEGKTWKDVNGAYRWGSRQMLVGQVNPNRRSAVLHEGGHALDHALDSVSHSATWRRLHKQTVDYDKRMHSPPWISPYFTQSGDSGPEEFWAECISVWRFSVISNGDDRAAWQHNLAVEFGMSFATAGEVVRFMEKKMAEATKQWQPPKPKTRQKVRA